MNADTKPAIKLDREPPEAMPPLFVNAFTYIKNPLRVSRGRDSSANRKVAIRIELDGANAYTYSVLPLPGSKNTDRAFPPN